MKKVSLFALLALLLGSAYALQSSDSNVPLVTSPINEDILREDVLVCEEFRQVQEIFKAGRYSSEALDKAYNKYAQLENKNGFPVCGFGKFTFHSPEHIETIIDVHITGVLVVCDIFKINFDGETASFFMGVCSLREEEIFDEVVVMATSFFKIYFACIQKCSVIYHQFHCHHGISHGCHGDVCW